MLNQFHMVCPKFLGKKPGGLQKKKKGLYRNWVWFFGQNRKVKQFFSPKTSGLQKKKKKRSTPKLSLIFRPKSEIQTVFSHRITTSASQLQHPNFLWGGTVFNFSPKNWPKKQQKRAILHTSQANGGGLEPPTPTLLVWINVKKEQFFSILEFFKWREAPLRLLVVKLIFIC